MKTTKLPKKKQPKLPQKQKKRGLLVFLVTIAAVLLLILITNQIQTYRKFAADKVRFAQTEKDMNNAYNAIVKSLGQPYETNVTKSCAYGALKYARGPLGCMVTYSFSFNVDTRQAGDSNGRAAINTLNGNFGLSKGSISYGSSSLDQQGGQYSGYFDNAYGLACTLNHETYTTQEYNSFGKQVTGLKKNSNNTMSAYWFECEKNTHRAIYSISKSTE